MSQAPSRIGLFFALTLALPAAFAGAWAWLEHGGTIERSRQNEIAAAEQALAAAAAALDAELQHAAAVASFPITLDDERHVTAPFPPDGVPDTDVEIGLAEQAAGARLAAGDIPAAMPFFAHAAADRTLSPEGWLRYAELLAANDRDAARQALATARQLYPDAFCGGLPFALLAALRRSNWSHTEEARAAAAAELITTMLARAPRMPAAAVPQMIAAMIDAAPSLRDDLRLRELEITAAFVAGTKAAAAASAEPFADGVVVPRDDHHLAVLPRATTADCRAHAFARAASVQPDLCIVDADSSASPLPTRRMPSLGTTWTITPKTTPTSTLLAHAARTSLGLAIVTFVIGNLLLWRLTRREHALARLRSDFVDIVSHELRTPLAALSIKAEMLAAGDVPPARVPHYLTTLHHDVQRLGDQVERILAFGRLQKGAPLRREVISGRSLLARGLRSGRSSLQLVRQQLEVHAPRGLPDLSVDIEVMSRALRNLLENAAKYAPPGSTVAVRAFAEHSHLIVEVADRGPGVPAHERRAIFQPFVRSEHAPPGTPGSGLGLALVAAAARAHGGSVDVHPRDGGGALFTLRLPLGNGVAS